MTPAVYAVLAAFGTFLFLIVVGGIAYFAFQLMSTVRAATKAIEMIGPLLKGEELTRLTNAFILMGKQGSEMLREMQALDKTIALFYKFAVQNSELTASSRVVPTASDIESGSRFVGYDEAKAAAREAAAVAQDQG
jgi:hypothetical protein